TGSEGGSTRWPSAGCVSLTSLGLGRVQIPSCPAPKLVLTEVNGKRCPTPGITDTREEAHTPAHEENVRFVYEAWQQVEEELGASQQPENGQCTHGPVQYVEKTPNQNLKNFVPIDLEEWWAKQFLANIQNSS
ncbi:MAPK regulated corepressor interacting protein 2-like, partial [Heterodontus francisci]|uniref:MAPK regulated corepressor interacting protein 2-like n=1 Tax=Heterodontus francisci TaxID=7792 RepID=UPI00355C5354